MTVAEAAVAHRKAISLIIVVLVFAGIYSAFQLPSGIYPEVDFPRIIVVASMGDLPTGNVLLGVTRPIEESLSGVLGLYRVRSRTIRGEAEISLVFLPKADMQLALQQVQAKISEVRPFLPEQTQLTVERVTPALFPVMIFLLTGKNVPPTALRDYAQYTVRPTLSRIPGVGQVGVMGDTIREIQVVVDSRKMLAHHLTLEKVEDAIRRANTIEAVGRLNKDYKQFMILMSSEIQNLDTVNNIVVAGTEDEPGSMTYVHDIASVFEGSEDRTMLISGNGEAAAQINVTRQIGGNILAIEQDALQRISEIKGNLPSTVHLTTVYDLAEFVHDSIISVRDAIAIGCVLSVAILLLFLREWRSTLIAACSIPLTLVITLFFMQHLGQTLNLMSLGGMAVAIGLVIDDAIVVVENIHRHLQTNIKTDVSKESSVLNATNEILGAVSGSTFTTVVVFLPLALMEGVVGQFFAAFSITLSTAVLVSLVLSFTLIPLLAKRYLKEEKKESKKTDRFLQNLTSVYERTVGWALAHTGAIIVAALLLIGVGVGIYTQLASGFLPLMDEGSFVLDYWMPSGTSLKETDRVLKEIEQILKSTPEVESLSRRTGAELGLFATEQSSGDIIVRLRKKGTAMSKQLWMMCGKKWSLPFPVSALNLYRSCKTSLEIWKEIRTR